MVDFNKRLRKGTLTKRTNPVEIYDGLDRASDKGPLRPAQEAILQQWFTERRKDRDLIIKLHTGQGKTLIGLLILQSYINESPQRVVYLCPNNFLIEQTCNQAAQFGIPICKAEPELPGEFLDGQTILVTSVQKLFNGRTKFGLRHKSEPIAAILMDDCHACIDSIRDACSIRIFNSHPAYNAFLEVFKEDLRSQGAGTLEEIVAGNSESRLPVAYWAWQQKQDEIVGILSQAADAEQDKKKGEPKDVWFTWPLLKDRLQHCRCVVSGSALEIAPYIPPLQEFGSFWNAKHRIFMSATVSNDSFLVKGLQLSAKSIRSPLTYAKEKWSGEKMILLPSLINPTLDRETIVAHFGKPVSKRDFGVVCLATSFRATADWDKYGSEVAKTEDITLKIEKLRSAIFDRTLVLVNRYDGVDLPDRMCRILIMDGKPQGESLIDSYEQDTRTGSEVTSIRIARSIEQGLGRSVRGEKDYSVAILIGSDLVKFVRNPATRGHLSNQTRLQIEIGLEVAKFAEEDVKGGKTPMTAFLDLVNQCLWRDPGWKEFYSETMSQVDSEKTDTGTLEVFSKELEAENALISGNPEKAMEVIQELMDSLGSDHPDRYWYLQEKARFAFALSHQEGFSLQVNAFNGSHYLLKPPVGVRVQRLKSISHARIDLISKWVREQGTAEQLSLTIDEILSRLQFGGKAEKFEEALKELGGCLGFSSERPDKEWKEGPDNLWGVADAEYLLFECKNEVNEQRAEINKAESGQMNNACAWFTEHYPGNRSTNIMIIPTAKLGKGAAFSADVRIMRPRELRKLHYAVKQFYGEFSTVDFASLSATKIQQWLDTHRLNGADFVSEFSIDSK